MRTDSCQGRMILIGVLFVVGAASVPAQLLSMPPAPQVLFPIDSTDSTGSTGGVLPDGVAWLGLRRFTDQSGAAQGEENPGHNYQYDVGTDFVIYRGARMQVEGMVRMMFFSAPPSPPETNTWLIDSQALAVEQNIRLRGGVGPVGVGVAFHHNSKHEVDQERRRTPIHDTLRLELDSPAWSGSYGPRDDRHRWWLQSHLRGEYAIEPIFQENVPEPYAGGVQAELRMEPWICHDTFAVFLDAATALIVNSAEGERSTDLDWLVRAGVRIGERRTSAAIFMDVHHLTDDWMTPASRAPARATDPWTLVSIGVAFRR